MTVYISYSHSNRAIAERLAHDLFNAGFDAWIDFMKFPPGTPRNEMLEEMQKADAFLICLSPAALVSKWVLSEIELARRTGKKIIPFMVESCWEMLAEHETVSWLSDIYILSIEKLTYEQVFQQLVRALSGLPKVFISYRRLDSRDAVGRIFDRLSAYFGEEALFRDVDYIKPGMNFKKRIESTLDQAVVVLVIIGEKWLEVKDEHGRRRLDSPVDFVRLEIEMALQRNIRIIPVRLNNVAMPDPDQLPASSMFSVASTTTCLKTRACRWLICPHLPNRSCSSRWRNG
ncbi:MAG: toll/interleukin-1 receptor domain-containing protein, partial [Anaerolineae bacterium]|nr:toll/interleukin-1 receptor domain-containing protein [Anaerolineae bacterium]